MGKIRVKERLSSNNNKLSDSEDSFEDFSDGYNCPFPKKEEGVGVDDTMTEYFSKLGRSLSSLETVQKTMSTSSTDTSSSTNDGLFKFSKEKLFSKESMNVHSKNRHRKKSPSKTKKLKVIKDPGIKPRRRDSRTEATVIARKLVATTTSKYSKRTDPHFPVPHPIGKSFSEKNVTINDTRNQNVATPYQIIDHFSSKYKDGGGGTRFQCMLCYPESDKIVEDNNKNIAGTFGAMHNFRFHFRTMHGTKADRPFECPECLVGFLNQSTLDDHLVTHSDVRTIKCAEPSCDKMFTHKYHMTLHWNREHGDTPHICLECGKRFGSNSGLLTHHSTCHSDSSFQCHCCRVFKTWGNFILHIQVSHLKKDRVKCARTICARVLQRHNLWHEKNKNMYCTVCELELDDRDAYMAHLEEEKHQKLFKDTFSSSIYPHCVPLDGSESKEFYPYVEYDVLDKYNNNIFTPCPSEKNCQACPLITVVSCVYYLTSKWVVPDSKVPFNCSTTMTLYMALLTNENFNGKFIQYRYVGQTQKFNTNGFGGRVIEHENGHDGEKAAKIFREMKGIGWKREYIFLFGCPPEKKQPHHIEFGERNFIQQFQSQDDATNGFNSQDGGTMNFIKELKNAGFI